MESPYRTPEAKLETEKQVTANYLLFGIFSLYFFAHALVEMVLMVPTILTLADGAINNKQNALALSVLAGRVFYILVLGSCAYNLIRSTRLIFISAALLFCFIVFSYGIDEILLQRSIPIISLKTYSLFAISFCALVYSYIVQRRRAKVDKNQTENVGQDLTMSNEATILIADVYQKIPDGDIFERIDLLLLSELLKNVRITTLLSKSGVLIDQLKPQIKVAIVEPKASPSSKKLTPAYPLEKIIEDALTKAYATHEKQATLETLLAVIIDKIPQTQAANLMIKNGLNTLLFRHILSHGSLPLDPDLPLKGPCQIRVHNDAFTSVEFVLSLFTDLLKMSPELANKKMLSIHQHGFGDLELMDVEEVVATIKKIRETANNNGFPLRLSLVQ